MDVIRTEGEQGFDAVPCGSSEIRDFVLADFSAAKTLAFRFTMNYQGTNRKILEIPGDRLRAVKQLWRKYFYFPLAGTDDDPLTLRRSVDRRVRDWRLGSNRWRGWPFLTPPVGVGILVSSLA